MTTGSLSMGFTLPEPRRAATALALFSAGAMAVTSAVGSIAAPPIPVAIAQTAVAAPVFAASVAGHGRVPVMFEENRGQADGQVRFVSRVRGSTVFLTAEEMVTVLSNESPAAGAQPREVTGSVLRMRLLGANPMPQISGKDVLTTKSNYFLGKDPSKWRAGIPNYAGVLYKDVYPGIDMDFHGGPQGLEYDFDVAPGANPESIYLDFRGADSVKVDGQGSLVVATAAGAVRHQRPVMYQEVGGAKRTVSGEFSAKGSIVSFKIGGYDRSRPLTIDPLLSYSTYLGGSGGGAFNPDGAGTGSAIAVDSAGSAYVTGRTTSPLFPTTSGAVRTTYPGVFSSGGTFPPVAFVTKLMSDGSGLVYSTYLGGSGSGSFPFGDQASGIAIDGAGNAYVSGTTDSPDFPLMNPIVSSLPPRPDPSVGDTSGFVTKLNSTGAALVYSTYLGGSSGRDQARGIAVDSSNSAFIVGGTSSVDFPTSPNALLPNCPRACFADGHSVGGSTTYTSATANFTSNDEGQGITGTNIPPGTSIATDVNATTVTLSNSATADGSNLTFQFRRPKSNGYITRLSAAGSAFLYSSYLGGTGIYDVATGVAVDAGVAAKSYITGKACSADFPTKNPIQGYGGHCDAFVTKIDTQGSGNASLVYSTTLGGSSADGGPQTSPADGAIAVDPSGNAYVTGLTSSTDFPTTPGAFQPACPSAAGGCLSTYVSKLNAAGSALVYSTYLGGSRGENGVPISPAGIAADASGQAFVTGATASPDFPAVQPVAAFGGTLATSPGQHAFLTKLNATGSAPVYSTPLGGSGGDQGYGVALDPAGSAYVAGSTTSADFPTTPGVFQFRAPSGYGGFVSKIATVGASVPVVTGLSPGTGSVTGGTSVTLMGVGFTGASSVQFGGAAAMFAVMSDTRIVATSPAQSSGTASIVVTVVTPSGPSPANPISRFVYGEGGWSATASLPGVLFGQSATLLAGPNCGANCGKVLVAGGAVDSLGSAATSSAALYDPASGTWTGTGSMANARFSHSATLLQSGKVLIVGGTANNGTPMASTELYDPASGSWNGSGSLGGCSPASASCIPRFNHTATLLTNGNVLVTGGTLRFSGDRAVSTGEVYDSVAGTWSPVANVMSDRRTLHTATLLADGKVLVAGGFPGPTATSDLYDPAANRFHITGAMTEARFGHTATLLPDGRVIAIGGADGNNLGLDSAEIYDAKSGSWGLGATMELVRGNHVATLLPNGKVLVAGGSSGALAGVTATAEVFDSASSPSSFGSGGLLGSRRGARVFATSNGPTFTATLLSGPNCAPNCGKVLIVGGSGDNTAELYTQSDRTLAGVVGSNNALFSKRDQLPYQSLDGFLITAPAVVTAPGSPLSPLYVGVGSDHKLYVRSEGLSWQSLVPAGSGCIDNPAATVTPDGSGGNTLTVACQGLDHALYSIQTSVNALTLPTANTTFQALGGALLAGPAVASVNGTLTYFAEGTDHFIYSRTGASGNPYVQIPAQCIGHPAAASLGTDAYLACQGLDGQLYYSKNHNGGGWSGFRSAGGQLIDGPGIAATSTGVTVYVEGVNQELFHTVVALDATSSSAYADDGGIIQYGAGAVGLRAGQ